MKPDGWHTYHVCGGQVREVRRVVDHDDNASLMCVNCGEWFEFTVIVGGAPRSEPEEVPA